MQIYVINLDRHPARWQRIAGLLHGLAIKRIAAVDGKNLEGPEYRDHTLAFSYENLSRYERACILSHRFAWQEFLNSNDPYSCILEDDVFISSDFHRFIKSETWIPMDCNLVKIETTEQEVFISRKTINCLERKAALLRSLHFGTAAYIISRRGAEACLKETLQSDRPMDHIMFDETGLRKLHPVYQLLPVLCIQANQRADGMIFSELESSIQPKVNPQASPQIQMSPQITPAPKTLLNKIKREGLRPFRQLSQLIQIAGVHGLRRLKGVHRCRVPFA